MLKMNKLFLISGLIIIFFMNSSLFSEYQEEIQYQYENEKQNAGNEEEGNENIYYKEDKRLIRDIFQANNNMLKQLGGMFDNAANGRASGLDIPFNSSRINSFIKRYENRMSININKLNKENIKIKGILK